MANKLAQYELAASQDPFRSPDWRYKCAEAYCYETDTLKFPSSTRVKSSWIRRFNRYLEQQSYTEALAIFLAASDALEQIEIPNFGGYQDSSVSGEAAQALMQAKVRSQSLNIAFGFLGTAFEVYSNKERSILKAELEGRVLAGCTDEEITRYLGTAPQFVPTYIRCFFDVRDKLSNASYIHRIVLKYRPNVGIEKASLEDQIRYWGYHAGNDFIDAFLHQQQIRSEDKSKTTEERLDDLFIGMVRAKSLAGLATMEVNKFNVVQLLQLHAEMYHKRLEAESNAEEQGTYDKLIASVLEAAEWNIGVQARKKIAQTPVGDYLNTAAELRTEELFKLKVGEPVTLDGVKEMTFPERRKETDDETSK